MSTLIMRGGWHASCLIAAIGLAGCAQSSPRTPHASNSRILTFDFEEPAVGQLPADFTAAQTGPGAPPEWVIHLDRAAASGEKVLAQRDTDNTRNRYPLCIYEDLQTSDVDVSVQYKLISGEIDQAAGIVVRLQDKDNYYITRANALEDNIRFYKVQDGKRTQLATAALQTTANEWHTLRLKSQGNRFEIYHDGNKMLDVTDETFARAGKVGLWTKADSVTYFDNLKVQPLSRQ